MPVSVATPRCGVWPTVLCGVLGVDRRLFPFRLLRCAQNRNQRARHNGGIGLRYSWEARKVSSTMGSLSVGKLPKTGPPTIRDIAQAEQFALNVVQRRPTQCRYAYFRSSTRLGTGGCFTPKCERERRGCVLAQTQPYPSIREYGSARITAPLARRRPIQSLSQARSSSQQTPRLAGQRAPSRTSSPP